MFVGIALSFGSSWGNVTFSQPKVGVMVTIMNVNEQPGIYLRTMADMLGEWELLLHDEKVTENVGWVRGRESTQLKPSLRTLIHQIEQETGRPFILQEKMLWTPEEGFFLQELHLERLDASAAAFGVPYDQYKLRTAIQKQVWELQQPSILTIELSLQGELHLHRQAHTLPITSKPLQLTVASTPINLQSPLLYYSTNYPLFDHYLIRQPHKDALILWNERHELTQTTVGNLVVEQNGELCTPDLACGVVPGTFRAELLNTQKIKECTLYVEDVVFCGRVWVIDSIHKWREARIVCPDDGFPPPNQTVSP
jgi:4-amino-4-deoxychorismate lyase